MVRLRGGEGAQNCGACAFFEPPASCKSVMGEIAPTMLCDLFTPIEGPGDEVSGTDQSIMDMLGGIV